MAKKIVAQIKLQCPGGQAQPNQTIAPPLGQNNVNIGEFIKRFNDATREQMGITIPVIVSVFEDRTFDLTYKKPPAATLIKLALGLEKGAGDTGHGDVTGVLTKEQLRAIAEQKMPDLNTGNAEAAQRIIAGTARSMGVKVEE